MKRFRTALLTVTLPLALLSVGSADAQGSKREWHDWVGPLDWCGFDCDAGEACCKVIAVE